MTKEEQPALDGTERQLLARLKQGDRAAFARLVTDYSPHIYGQALRMMQDPAEALGLSTSAVKSRLLRARLRLRNDLSTYFSERIAQGENQ